MTAPQDMPAAEAATPRAYRLVIDTATRQSTVAVGSGAVLLAESRRVSEHRHGAALLEQIDEVLARASVGRRAITAIGVGTGPGSFTGLRVGMATAKTLAYALAIPVAGIPTGDSIGRAVLDSGSTPSADAPRPFAVLLPAGARDHYLAVSGQEPRLIPPDADLATMSGDALLVAVDLPGANLGVEAAERGALGLRGLAAAMLLLLDERLATGSVDDAASLVPAYVALPRGVPAGIEGMAWSPDLR